jgi:hypothetical protein
MMRGLFKAQTRGSFLHRKSDAWKIGILLPKERYGILFAQFYHRNAIPFELVTNCNQIEKIITNLNIYYYGLSYSS